MAVFGCIMFHGKTVPLSEICRFHSMDFLDLFIAMNSSDT